MVAHHTLFLTSVSSICPFACWPLSQSSYAFLPNHALQISMLLGCTTHTVPDIGSSFSPFAFWQLSSPSYNILLHHCLQFSILLDCMSHVVPDLGSSLCPFAFLQLNHHPQLHPRQRSSCQDPGLPDFLMLCLLPPIITFTFYPLPPHP
jgi:hypothetical protein